MEVACWCCGRATEAVTLKVNIPKALYQHLIKTAEGQDLTPTEMVQKALYLHMRAIEELETEDKDDGN
jgi:hypothetical protein